MIKKLHISEDYNSNGFAVTGYLSPNNRGVYADRYFDANEWSEVESYAHELLMQGLYVNIIYFKTGDQINIDPDEYIDNFDGEFDVTNDIADFKYRIMHESRCNRNRKSKYVKEEYTEPSISYSEFRKNYSWALKKYPDTYKFYDYYDLDCGELTITNYYKLGSRWKEESSETETFTGREYMNGVDGSPFFSSWGGSERIKTTATKFGYIPCEISSISPDRKTKTVRTYKFISKIK